MGNCEAKEKKKKNRKYKKEKKRKEEVQFGSESRSQAPYIMNGTPYILLAPHGVTQK